MRKRVYLSITRPEEFEDNEWDLFLGNTLVQHETQQSKELHVFRHL